MEYVTAPLGLTLAVPGSVPTVVPLAVGALVSSTSVTESTNALAGTSTNIGAAVEVPEGFVQVRVASTVYRPGALIGY
jgi:hypothetical protein